MLWDGWSKWKTLNFHVKVKGKSIICKTLRHSKPFFLKKCDILKEYGVVGQISRGRRSCISAGLPRGEGGSPSVPVPSDRLSGCVESVQHFLTSSSIVVAQLWLVLYITWPFHLIFVVISSCEDGRKGSVWLFQKNSYEQLKTEFIVAEGSRETDSLGLSRRV